MKVRFTWLQWRDLTFFKGGTFHFILKCCHLHTQSRKQILYFRIEYHSMMSVPHPQMSSKGPLEDRLCPYIWMSNSHYPNS
jgi:hypothetical protein